MNEPPPPYSIQKCIGSEKWMVLLGGKIMQYTDRMGDAQIMRNQFNDAYMQGWRDRDEAEDDEQ